MAVKKQTIKKTGKVSTTKKTIDYKVVARNVIVVIDGKKSTKVIADKVEKQKFVEQINAYNKRNSKAKLKTIIDYLLADKETLETKTKKVEKVKKTVSKKKATVKKEPAKEELSVSDIDKAKELLKQEGYVISKKAEPRKRRRGEY